MITIDLPIFADLPPEPLNVVRLSQAGTIHFNDESISDDTLRRWLRAGLSKSIEPVTRFEPHANTSFRRVLEVLGIFKTSGITKFCFGNLHQFRVFHKHPQPLYLTLMDAEDFAPEYVEAPIVDAAGCNLGPERDPFGLVTVQD